MGDLNKIRNINLADLDENNKLEDLTKGGGKKKSSEPQVTEKMADPIGRHYEINATIEKEELSDFLLSHAYHQPTTYVLMLMGVAFAAYNYVTSHNLLVSLAIAAAIIGMYPIILMQRAKKIKNANTTFSEEFHYMFDEKGCHLQLSREAIDVEWKYFKKIICTKRVAVIYTSNKHGYIVPVKDMGEQKEEILAFLKEKISR